MQIEVSTRTGRSCRGLRRWFPLLLACAALAPLAGAAGPRTLLNHQAPVFTRRAFDGRVLSLASFRGKVVLLNFWATWCAPCQAEMPTFAGWQRQYAPQGFQVIGISMDDDAAPARKLAQKLRIDYPVALGDASLGEKYGGVLGLPITYLIDRHGTVRAFFQGNSDLGKMEAQFLTLLRTP